jgi:hypothetical protein
LKSQAGQGDFTSIAHPQDQHDHAIVLNAWDDPEISDAVFPELTKCRSPLGLPDTAGISLAQDSVFQEIDKPSGNLPV